MIADPNRASEPAELGRLRETGERCGAAWPVDKEIPAGVLALERGSEGLLREIVGGRESARESGCNPDSGGQLS